MQTIVVTNKNFPVLKEALDVVWCSAGTDTERPPAAYELEGFTVAQLVTAEAEVEKLGELDGGVQLDAFLRGSPVAQSEIALRTPELALADRVLMGPDA